MFVAINNVNKSAIYLDGEIKNARNNGEITPEFAMDILAQTNHRTNIKTLVKAIKDKCANKEDILPYREFILSSVDGREVEGGAFDNLREMAKLCECEEEFDKANNKPKFYEKFDYANLVCVTNKRQYEELEGEGLRVFWDVLNQVSLKNCDLSKVKKLKFNARNIVLTYVKNLPEVLDLSVCDEVNLSWCDLSKVKELKFKDGAKVNFSGVQTLPEVFDIYIHFPEVLDLSKCDEVNLSYCDLSGVKELKFKEGAKVNLLYADNLPEYLDVSMCDEVNLSYCDLSKVKELKFKDGAKVDLSNAKNLPKDLDVSMCDEVNLRGCDLSKVWRIRFKDKEQKEKFLQGMKVGYARVVYGIIEKNKVGNKDEEKRCFGARLKRVFDKGLE